ncbi:hypothetical protein AB3N60_11235 [Leptospira sp. WS39.C2]
MKNGFKIILFLSIISCIIFHCGHYRQTKKVTKNAFGTDYLHIEDILKIGIIEKNKILIVTATTTMPINNDPLLIRDRRCFILDLENQNNEKFYQYNINPSNFSSDCNLDIIHNLNYKLVNIKEFESYDKNEKKEIIRLKIESLKKFFYIKVELEEKELNKFPSYTLKSPFYKKNKTAFILLYPLALPYDIVAGTLHSIGYIFFSIAWFNGALMNNSLPIYRRIPNYILIGTYRAFSYLDNID